MSHRKLAANVFAVSVSVPSVRTTTCACPNMQQNPLKCLLTFIEYKLLCTSDAFSDTTFKELIQYWYFLGRTDTVVYKYYSQETVFIATVCVLICYIHHVEMQLNDVIKVQYWLLLGICNLSANTTKTDTNVGIGASLLCSKVVYVFSTFNSCSMGTSGLPDLYTWTRQITSEPVLWQQVLIIITSIRGWHIDLATQFGFWAQGTIMQHKIYLGLNWISNLVLK